MSVTTKAHIKQNLSQAFIYIDRQRFDTHRYLDQETAEELQTALAGARKRYGHALCECRKIPLRLQIKKLDGKYHLAVWPDEGIKHDSVCVFFREERQSAREFAACITPADAPAMAVAGPSAPNAPASSQKNGSPLHQTASPPHTLTGAVPTRFKVNLAFSFGMQSGAREVHPQRHHSPVKAPQDGPKPDPAVGLRGLANLLWEESGLTRWHPKWQRDWGRSRFELLKTAETLLVKSTPLSHHLFIPRVFRKDLQEILNKEARHFIETLSKGDGKTMRSGIMIGPARKMVHMADGTHALHLRHLVHPVGMPQGVVDFLSKECETACTRIDQIYSKPEPQQVEDAATRDLLLTGPEVIAFLHVRATPMGALKCLSAWLMMTHSTTFIPTATPNEVRLVDALVGGGHQFSRVLSTEQIARRNHYDWIARHVIGPEGRPVDRAGLDLIGSARSPTFVGRRDNLANRQASKGIPCWRWYINDEANEVNAPPLPPTDNGDLHRGQLTLEAIQKHPDVRYSFTTQGLQR